MTKIENSWDDILKDEFKKEYYLKLIKTLDCEYEEYVVYPPREDIFNALKYTSYEDVKVVILGQDPYHGKGQAHGLAFSVNKGVKIPPSLLNIYKELNKELDLFIPNNGYLMDWANQGVLLLNTSLTVREGEANSHKSIGWEIFTDNIIKYLNEKDEKIIFVLWGNNAKSKKIYIDNSKHYILESVHPSPLSANRGFFGCNHFIKVNEILKLDNKNTIDWQIKNIDKI